MKGLIVAAAALGLAAGAAAAADSARRQQPAWAYAVSPDAIPPLVDDGKLLRLPGAKGAYTVTRIRGRDKTATPPGPVDWYPGDHPAMPRIVAVGDKPATGRACSLCHYPNGKGRSENAPVAGLPKAYIVEQLHDMASGARRSAEPLKANAFLMDDIAKGLTETDIAQAAAYFSAMPWTRWIRVVESATAPKVRSNAGLMIPVTGSGAGTEPLDGRIVETPVDPYHTETLRDPHSPFVAYVPIGSIERGGALVTTGGAGRTTPCATCHGPDLNGVGNIPGIAARSPSYLARQLNDFRQGARHGQQGALMQPVAARLTDAEITDIVAYLASRPAPAPKYGS
jgi:cytochrome c553